MEEEQRETEDGTRVEKSSPLVKKKMIILSSMMCGALAFLLWGLFKFPKKFGITRMLKNNTCLENAHRCLHGWTQINNNCFFPSEHETAWIDSQENCRLYYASLANFDSQDEMESLMRHLKPSSYWIGLNKLNANSTWKWSDGSQYQNWFDIEEKGDCAFLWNKGLNSSSCDDTRKYLCSKTTSCL